MRRGRSIGGVALAVTVFLALALTPAALAGGTPMDICKDLQDGTLNGTYTVAELQAFFSDPTVQGYCGPIAGTGAVTPGPTAPPQAAGVAGTATSGVKGVAKTVSAAAPTHAVLGAQHSAAAPARSAAAPLAATKTRGTLPFTGAQLTLFALVGLALLATGVLLRSTARQSKRL
jgi:hypothetical protein